MNVLITSLSAKVPLIQAFRDALDEGTLWGGDADPGCVGRYFCDRFWHMPRLSGGAEDAVLEFCVREEIRLLVPTRDGELSFFAALRERLEAQGCYSAVGAPDALETCLDKLSFHAHCRESGIPVAATSESLNDLPGDTFVVKPRRGAGARAGAIGLDREQARTAAEELNSPLFQPTLAGREHSVDVYVNREGRVVEAAPRERVRVVRGESAITETVEHPGLVEAAVALAESLDLRGHLVVQGFASGPDAVLFECNARVGGASTLGFRAGVDSPRWSIQEAAGVTVEPRLGSYARDLRLVRYPADLVEQQ